MSSIPVTTPQQIDERLLAVYGTFTLRLEHGLCLGCGTHILEKSTPTIVVPRTEDGVVMKGRCLYCYPDNKSKNSFVSDDNNMDTCFVIPDDKHEIIKDSPMERSVAVMNVERNSDHESSSLDDNVSQPRNKNMKRKQAPPERSGLRKSKMMLKIVSDDDTKQSDNSNALSMKIGIDRKKTEHAVVADEVAFPDNLKHNTRKKMLKIVSDDDTKQSDNSNALSMKIGIDRKKTEHVVVADEVAFPDNLKHNTRKKKAGRPSLQKK